MRIRFSRGLPVPMLYQMLYVTRPACGFDIAMTLAASRAPGVPLLYCELPISLQRVVILFCYPGRPFSLFRIQSQVDGILLRTQLLVTLVNQLGPQRKSESQ